MWKKMIRPCSSLLRNFSLTTFDRLTTRTSLNSVRDLSYNIQRPSFFSVRNLANTQRRPWISRFSATASSESQSSNEAKSSAGEEQDTIDAAQPSEKKMEELRAAIESYKEKLSTIEDKYKRQLAETENVRQRFMRQVDEAKSFGIQNFCKDLLEIADILELATESVPKEELSKAENVALKQLYDGLVMTQTELTKTFNKHGLVAVRPSGEKFNPNIHEAVFQVKDDEKESGSIANVVKIGYLLHDRLIRPAKVGVYISS